MKSKSIVLIVLLSCLVLSFTSIKGTYAQSIGGAAREIPEEAGGILNALRNLAKLPEEIHAPPKMFTPEIQTPKFESPPETLSQSEDEAISRSPAAAVSAAREERLNDLFHELDVLTKSLPINIRTQIWSNAYDFGDNSWMPILDKVALHFLLSLKYAMYDSKIS